MDKNKIEDNSEDNSNLYEIPGFEENVCLKKYKITQPKYAFKLFPNDNELLFIIGDGWFGSDICIYKEQFKSKSYCSQTCFDYGNEQNVLVGKEGKSKPFTPLRIVVLQMAN